MNVLFLGNSLIFYNDMPKLFEQLARAAGKDIFVDSVTKGSATISHFAAADDPLGIRAREMLAGRSWDYVIIEPSRRISPFEDSVLRAETQAAQVVRQLAAEAGAKILLYAVWGNNNGEVKEHIAEAPPRMPAVAVHPYPRREHTLFMHQVAHQIADVLGDAPIAEAGLAFERMLDIAGDTELYHTDLRHPSLAGSYLAACVIFCTIFGEKTEHIPYTAELTDCHTLQTVADAIVFGA